MTDRQVWAFAVKPAPREGGGPVAALEGGRVPESAPLEGVVSSAERRAKAEDWTDVDFRVHEIADDRGGRRSCATRDDCLDLAFGSTAQQDAGAVALASRLSAAMDGRSHSHLLVLIEGVDGAGEAEVTAWTFPHDDALRFDARGVPKVEVLADVFSQTSRLRKAAVFKGRPRDTSFLSGKALDLQTGRASIDVANYWVGKFLQCQLAITPLIGTENLANAIKKLDATLTDPQERATLTIAVLHLQRAPQRSWTLDEFADQNLPPALGERLRASSDPNLVHARFELETEAYSRLLNLKIYTLDNGVVVSSPISQVGSEGDATPVVVTGTALVAKGTIVKERFSASRRGSAA